MMEMLAEVLVIILPGYKYVLIQHIVYLKVLYYVIYNKCYIYFSVIFCNVICQRSWKNDIRCISRIQRVEWVLARQEWILFWTFWLQVNCAIGMLKCLPQSWKIELELGTTGRSVKTGLEILPLELVPEVMSMRVISDMEDIETRES